MQKRREEERASERERRQKACVQREGGSVHLVGWACSTGDYQAVGRDMGAVRAQMDVKY